MTTRQAFETLTNQRAWYKRLGYTETKASSLKHKHKKGTLTIDAMEKVLEDAGYRVIQEKQWKHPGIR